MSVAEVIWQAIGVGVLGASVGSFLNVVILRTQARKPFLSGRSKCPHCGRVLHWWEMVPIGSYVLLGGRCRTCRKNLHLQYLLVESLMASGFILVWAAQGWTISALVGLVVLMSMVLIGVYDARWKLIPDNFSFMFIGAALLWSLIDRRPALDILLGVVVGACFFGLQYMLSKGKWIGSGDILLGLGLGALLGWKMFLITLMLAYISGAVIGSVMIMVSRRRPAASVAFGPYLMLAGFVTWLIGPWIFDWFMMYGLPF